MQDSGIILSEIMTLLLYLFEDYGLRRYIGRQGEDM